MLKHFTYKFNEGPLSTIKELMESWNIGNCRRAVQYYIFKKKNIFLNLEDVLCPKAYNDTGIFIMKEGEEFSVEKLIDGDIIYAEKIRNKEESPVNKTPQTFANKDEYIIALHTALFTEKKEIWHATAIEGSSCTWSIDKFLYFYKPIAVKRILF